MASADQIRSTIDRYIATFSSGDGAAWAACFSEDATQEDPVGTPANVGREAIEAFYANTAAMMGGGLRIVAKDEPIIIGNEAALALRANAGSGEARVSMPTIIDFMTFDEDGLITSLRAFWSFDSIVPDPE